MDKAKITDKLATECMGWEKYGNHWRLHKDGELPYYPAQAKIDDWHPLTDWNQMMGCVENMDDCLHLKQHGVKGVWCVIFCGLGSLNVEAHDWCHNEDPLLAIAEAIGKAQRWWED